VRYPYLSTAWNLNELLP